MVTYATTTGDDNYTSFLVDPCHMEESATYTKYYFFVANSDIATTMGFLCCT